MLADPSGTLFPRQLEKFSRQIENGMLCDLLFKSVDKLIVNCKVDFSTSMATIEMDVILTLQRRKFDPFVK